MYQSLILNWSFIWHLVKHDMKSRYAGSMMGLFWALLNPLLTILIFVLVFSNIMAMRLGEIKDVSTYVIYLCSGIIPWNGFHAAIHRSSTVFLDYSNLIKKTLFPKETLIAQIVMTMVLDLAIGLSIFFFVLIFLGHSLSFYLLLLPVVILFQTIFSFGLSLIFSTLNVFFRDLSQLTGIILHIWFWLTPIVYPMKIIPEKFLFLIKLNPMTYLMGIYRDLFLYSRLPDSTQVIIFLLIAVVTITIGTKVYSHLKDEIPDEV